MNSKVFSGLIVLMSVALPALSSTAAVYYGQSHDFPLQDDERNCTEILIEIMPYAGNSKLKLDLGLVKAARSLADQMSSDPSLAARRPSPKLIRKKLREAGIAENRFYFNYTLYQPGGELRPYLENQVKAMADRNPYTNVGVGVSEPGSDPPFLVVIMSEKLVRIKPFPKEVSVGDRIELEGKLVGPGTGLKATALLTPPSGKVLRVPLLLDREEFFAVIPFSYGQGTYRLEIMVSGKGKADVASLLEISASGESEGSEKGMFNLDFEDKTYTDPGKAEADVIRMVNQVRERGGLKPLRENPRLTDMARAHSKDMMKNEYVGHFSPEYGSVDERASRAGIGSVDVMENVVVNPSIKKGVEELLSSPVHRRNIIDPEFNRIGVGVAITRKGNQTWYYITQEFAAMP
jgi:hypothetical protein